MSRFEDLGIKARLVLLAAAAMLPFLLLVIGGLVYSYEDATATAEKDVRKTAEIASDRVSHAFDDARARLEILRELPELRRGSGISCHAFLMSMRAANPQFLTIGVLDARGEITCHSREGKLETFTDPVFGRRVLAMEPTDFAVGQFRIGANSGRPTVFVAMPLPRVRNEPSGIIYASLNLGHLQDIAREMSGKSQRSILLLESQTSRVLARWPKPVAFGTAMPDHPAASFVRDNAAGGVRQLTDVDGTVRIYGIAPVRSAGESGLVLLVGESRALVMSALNWRSFAAVLLALLALSTAIGAASWLGSEMQVRPIRRLALTAARISAGQFYALTGIETWQAPEFRELASQLDTMAVALDKGRQAEQAIAVSEARYRLVADNTTDIITCVDTDGRYTFVSGASLPLLGYKPTELGGLLMRDVVHPDDRPIVDDIMTAVRAGQTLQAARYRARHCDGYDVWVEVAGRAVEGRGEAVLAIRDATHRKAMEDHIEATNQRLASLASTDDLTQLPNRRTFNQTISTELALCARTQAPLALVLIDVDRFKAYNDGYGHQAGDDCLKRVAHALRTEARRPGDIVTRYGGEEFAAILPNTTLSGALERADAMRRAVREMSIVHGGSEHGRVTVSIGVACLFDAGREEASAVLIRQADQALYEAKARGRDAIEAFPNDVPLPALKRSV
ncbi:hypothetical protein ASG43_01925 [Aureimonas sp. Leaf454]|uniref:sensor domain-containing diguanylate cyclase n=1 Tax=Aureimonas sp. Leaf454 TaxID=1736381 RepID=UPI0006F7840B|nr:diguanylate cyclase [Aureimonas sp. Leaf454]KQT54389.1 hypothetical protein ASG43_01925 [Aureimonas sp. Leaf454]